jgi:hypothetical protein
MLAASLFDVQSPVGALLLAFCGVLLLILIVSFRSRPVVFCQYLRAMTGIRLSQDQVKQAYATRGQEGVRDLFLELIIKEDLQQGPIAIPEAGEKAASGKPVESDGSPG